MTKYMATVVATTEVVRTKLDKFLQNNKIPNLLFYGVAGAGKKTLVDYFIKKIYRDNEQHIKQYVMVVNCAFGKGIRFIREDLKFFAKIHVSSSVPAGFKVILLLNADKLTNDAQSALRRSIELFSGTTRFFIVVENKHKLLLPILSRFCEIFVYRKQPQPQAEQETPDVLTKMAKRLQESHESHAHLVSAINDFYEEALSGADVVAAIKLLPDSLLSPQNKVQTEMCYSIVRSEFRNEKLLMLFLLDYAFFKQDKSLRTLSFL